MVFEKIYKWALIRHNISNRFYNIINRRNKNRLRLIFITMDKHKKIIDFLKKTRVITSSELAKHIGVSWNTAEKYLLELALEGKIERIKKEKVNLWMMK